MWGANLKFETWSLDTAYGNGLLVTKDHLVVGGAPIFNRLRGQSIDLFPRHYQLEKLSDETEESVQLFLRRCRRV